MKVHDYEIENLKQIIKEKDVIIENNTEKISELECHLLEVKEQCTTLQDSTEVLPVGKEISPKAGTTTQLNFIMKSYEKFISEITANYEIMKEERNLASTHLANLEFSFTDLVEKYERLKAIVIGYQQNQQTLLEQTETYENAIKVLQTRYDDLKKYATDKLNEANAFIKKNEKNYISELAKVKSQVLQSKVRITELENTIENISKNKDCSEVPKENSKQSLFKPLATIFQLP